MSKKKSITKNYIYNLIYQILVILMPIITTPYLARTLGPGGTGIYSYTISIVTYFILVGSLGVSMYGQREIAFVQDDVKKRSKIFYELVILRLMTMTISMLVFYLINGRTGDYAIYYRILLLEMIANCVDISWFYQGLENFRKTALRNIVVKLLSVISIFLFIKNENDVSKYLLIYVLTTLLGNASLWIGVRRYIDKVELKDLQILKQLKPTIYLFIPQIAIQIYTVLDKTMIGAITNNMTEVGFYEQTQKVIKILLTIITSLGAVMMPRIAKCFADGEKEKIKEYMKNTFRFVFLLAFPMIFGIIAVSNSFVPIFFGEGYDKVKLLLKIMSPIILFIGLSNVTGTQYLLSTKKQKQFTISVLCGATVNAILNFILITKYNSLGAVIATVFAELTVMSVQFYFVRKDFDLLKVLKISGKYLLLGLIMFVICLIPGKFIEKDIYKVVIQVIVGIAVYGTGLLITKDELVINIKNKLIKK